MISSGFGCVISGAFLLLCAGDGQAHWHPVQAALGNQVCQGGITSTTSTTMLTVNAVSSAYHKQLQRQICPLVTAAATESASVCISIATLHRCT